MHSHVDPSLSSESSTPNSAKSAPASHETPAHSALPEQKFQSTFTSPKAMTSDPQRFKLDMSFNRHNPATNLKRRFACAIDPLASSPAFQHPLPAPSGLVADPSPKEWQSHYRKWSFPTRTDSPRGLTWGPYHSPVPSAKVIAPLSSSSSRGTKRSRNMITSDLELPVREPKRRRLLPILRPPCNPFIVRLKAKSGRPTLEEGFSETSASMFLNDLAVNYLEELVKVVVSPTAPRTFSTSRITLCISSQVKYGSWKN